MARPRVRLSGDEIRELKAAYLEYIEGHDDPITAGFVANNPVAIKYALEKENIEEWPCFTKLYKRALAKTEWYLATQKGTSPMAIFRLKQKQWNYSDRIEQNITSEGQVISFVNNVPRPGTLKKKGRPPKTERHK